MKGGFFNRDYLGFKKRLIRVVIMDKRSVLLIIFYRYGMFIR